MDAEEKRRETAGRRGRIIAVARRLFVEKGYERTSLDDVIAEAGGSRRNVYVEFGGKDGLLRAVIEEIIGEIAVGAELPDDDAAPRDWLIAVGIAFVTRMTSPEVTAVFRQFIAQGGTDRAAADRLWEAGPVRFRRALEDWLRRQHAAGTLYAEDPEFLASVIPEMMRGGLQIEILSGRRSALSRSEIRTQVEKSVDLILSTVQPGAAEGDGGARNARGVDAG